MTRIDAIEAIEGLSEALGNLVIGVTKAIQEKRASYKDAPEVVSAIAEVIRAVGDVPMPAPDGVEFGMRVYICCPAESLDTVLNFPGNNMQPPRTPDGINLYELIDQLPIEHARRLKAVGEWRVMTRKEITAYKLREVRLAEARAMEAMDQRTLHRRQ